MRAVKEMAEPLKTREDGSLVGTFEKGGPLID